MLSVKEVARRLGVSPSLVYEWASSGLLPHYRFGRAGRRGKIMVDPGELEGFVAGMKAPGAAGRPDLETMDHLK